MYLVKTPSLVKSVFAGYVWDIPTKERVVYLTFDDGPIPGLTPWVLDVLSQYGCTATFFCVGENVKNNPEIFQRILDEGHSVGNHTYNHLNGWFVDEDEYLDNIALCDDYMDTILFRPPYGKLKPSQTIAIKNQKNIVMWDILSGDFDQTISQEKCLTNVLNNYNEGSIIVFHDNIKAEVNLKYALPLFLEHLKSNGFTSKNLTCLTQESSITV
jgi:peptidoglycan-N-acetylglucosamine deacetylase